MATTATLNDLKPGVASGLDRDIKKKIADKYDPQQEAECRQWIESVTGMPIGDDFHAGLKSGVILCELLNRLKPNTIKKINRGKMPFVQRENISNYLQACQDEFGMRQVDLFVTKDLFENYNMGQVLLNIYALSARSRTTGFQGPFIGTTHSTKNERNFSQEVLNAGKNMPNRQTVGSYGYQPSLDKSMDKIKRLDESQSKSHGGVSRQVLGSHGYQPEKGGNMDKIKRLDESQSKSHGGVSRQVLGSHGYQPEIGGNMDKIKRLDESQSKSHGGVSRQVQGSYGYQPEKEAHTDSILRGNQSLGAGSSVPSRQTQGSYGYQDTTDSRGVDQIIRNVDELQADRAKAKNRW
jgi:hypothetical protein